MRGGRRSGSNAWCGFAVVSLLGVVHVAAAWGGAAGSIGALRASTGAVGTLYILIGVVAVVHTLAQRELAPAFFDHALMTLLLLGGAWDLVSTFAFGVGDLPAVLLHVAGGGAVVVLVGALVSATLPHADAYARMVDSVLSE